MPKRTQQAIVEMAQRAYEWNEFKIRFCNSFNALNKHSTECPECAVYLCHGDGDLCSRGKTLIARVMVLQFDETTQPQPSTP